MKKTVCVYAILDDKTIETLVSKYIKLGISFKYEDVSRYVLFGNVPEVDEELSQNELNDMIHYFVGENLDIDIVLDKINELGISQLTEVDKKILELH
jgi:16S rRNA U1498 N3-methylase RsmE